MVRTYMQFFSGRDIILPRVQSSTYSGGERMEKSVGGLVYHHDAYQVYVGSFILSFWAQRNLARVQHGGGHVRM